MARKSVRSKHPRGPRPGARNSAAATARIYSLLEGLSDRRATSGEDETVAPSPVRSEPRQPRKPVEPPKVKVDGVNVPLLPYGDVNSLVEAQRKRFDEAGAFGWLKDGFVRQVLLGEPLTRHSTVQEVRSAYKAAKLVSGWDLHPPTDDPLTQYGISAERFWAFVDKAVGSRYFEQLEAADRRALKKRSNIQVCFEAMDKLNRLMLAECQAEAKRLLMASPALQRLLGGNQRLRYVESPPEIFTNPGSRFRALNFFWYVERTYRGLSSVGEER
jgi:hypothetical protein